MLSGLIAAFAGLVLQAQLQVGQSTVGQEFLLPAFTGALLGATSIRPGRTNVIGTLLAVAVLGGYRCRIKPAWRAILCRTLVQWLDVRTSGRSLRNSRAATRAAGYSPLIG